MKVTVITVTRNSAATLPETLSSVGMQTLPNIEHIVVDGASTDATADIVRRHGERVARFVSEPDHGIYDAMNKGLRLATGDIIGFLNADDHYADGDVLHRVLRAFNKGGVDAVFGDAAFFRPEAPQSIVRRYRSNRFHPDRLAWGWMPAHPTLFLRREIFQHYGHFRTDYRIAGDFDFIARVFKNGTVPYHYLPEVLVKMRTGGISTAGWKNTIVLNKEVLRACRENGIPSNLAKILAKYPMKIVEYVFR